MRGRVRRRQARRAAAQAEAFFQHDFLGPVIDSVVGDGTEGPKPAINLRSIFSNGGIALGSITYEDLADHPELDGLDLADAGALLALGRHDQGVNVFFVRNAVAGRPPGVRPEPRPGGPRRHGAVRHRRSAIDTLCYRSWQQLARLTAHEIARYMGLYHNVEIGATPANDRRDQIIDSDDQPENLMFYSELGGVLLSPGQRDILTRSPVLR